MDCSMLRTVGCFRDNGSRLLWENRIAPPTSKFRCGSLPTKTVVLGSPLGRYSPFKFRKSICLQLSRRTSWEAMAETPLGLDAEPSSGGDVAIVEGEEVPEASSSEEKRGVVEGEEGEEEESKLLTAEELKALLVDGERQRLVKKLSEANQHNRFLKRELQQKDDDLITLKTDLAVLEAELEDLVTLAEEVANSSDSQLGTRKINGKSVPSYLASKLQSVRTRLQQQIEGVELIKLQEVTLHWVGMAESVQVMGSFDGWSQGENMSPEYDGTYARFSTTLKLRPGKYEIKFLVDGVWQLSPELPTTGEGLMENNLLVL